MFSKLFETVTLRSWKPLRPTIHIASQHYVTRASFAVQATFRHTNLVAQDWQRLAKFYEIVFGMNVIPPIRDLKGEAFDDGVGWTGVRIQGAHLRFPGFDQLSDTECPTLEIFEYNNMPPVSSSDKLINRPGFGHIAFSVQNIQETIDCILKNGGMYLKDGELSKDIQKHEIAGKGILFWIYMRDCEANILEIQQSGG